MSVFFAVYDTVDNEVVRTSEQWPGTPNSVYRPVYGIKLKGRWHKYTANLGDFRYDAEAVNERNVPEVVRLAHMLSQ